MNHGWCQICESVLPVRDHIHPSETPSRSISVCDYCYQKLSREATTSKSWLREQRKILDERWSSLTPQQKSVIFKHIALHFARNTKELEDE